MTTRSNTPVTTRQTIAFFSIVLALLAMLYAVSITRNAPLRTALLNEDGWIESASAWGYFLCAAFMLFKGGMEYLKRRGYFLLLLAAFGMRELDYHKRFTTMGIFKIKFFLSHQVPIMEKAIGLLVILFLLAIVTIILKNHLREFMVGVLNRTAVSLGVVASFLLLATSKSMDGIDRKLLQLGIDMGDQSTMYMAGLEEVFELGIPIAIGFSFYAYFRQGGAAGFGAHPDP